MSINELKGEAGAEAEAAKPQFSDPQAAPVAASQTPPAASAKSAKADKKAKSAKPGDTWLETLQTIGIALAIALVVRSFLFQPFNIPSESMKPTLLVGDFLFVSKFSYGYSRHSLPFSLPFVPTSDDPSGRVLFGEPKRGDVIVFKTPADNRTDYIKRLIGLPGDEIQMIGGVLHINGAPVQRRVIGPYTSNDPRSRQETTGTLYEETLPNGVKYTTLDLRQSPADDSAEPFKVPAGHYFMMGDNRDNSTDSRFSTLVNGVGYVPAINLVGKAQLLFFSIEAPRPAWKLWEWVRGYRLFCSIPGLKTVTDPEAAGWCHPSPRRAP